jgi:DNA polymerase III subunit gamma/tau
MFVMDSNVKGAVAEQAIVLAATKLRIPVWRPVSEHGRADLVLEIGGELQRVQVKWGRLSPREDAITVVLHTSRRTRTGHVRSTYGLGEVELFAVYCGALDRCFLLPAPPLAGRNEIRLRLTPARNHQHACINLADDFAFDGAVAQLARARGWQPRGQGFESPQLHSSFPSGNPRDAPVTVGADTCRTQFGYWIERVRAGEDVMVTRRGAPVIRLSAAAPSSAPQPGPTAAPAPQPASAPQPHPIAAPAPPPDLGAASAPQPDPAAAATPQPDPAAARVPQPDPDPAATLAPQPDAAAAAAAERDIGALPRRLHPAAATRTA